MTASEIRLREALYAHPEALKVLEYLEEIKRQMYLDGAEDALQTVYGPSARIDRERAMTLGIKRFGEK